MVSSGRNSGLEIWVKIVYGNGLILDRFESQISQLFVLRRERPAVFEIANTHPKNMSGVLGRVLETFSRMQEGQVVDKLNVTLLMIKFN